MKEIQFSDDFIKNQFEREIVNSKNRFYKKETVSSENKVVKKPETESQKIGREAEEEFISNFTEYVEANDDQNINEHWDFDIPGWGKVDVKACKKPERWNKNTNDRFHVFEFRSVNKYNRAGWGMSKITDHIAFQTNEFFLKVELKKLQKFMEEKMGYSLEELLTIDMEKLNLVDSADKALYRFYTRKGKNGREDRGDLITVIETEVLEAMATEKIKRIKK